jgi:hypothetical protein
VPLRRQRGDVSVYLALQPADGVGADLDAFGVLTRAFVTPALRTGAGQASIDIRLSEYSVPGVVCLHWKTTSFSPRVVRRLKVVRDHSARH